MSHTPDWHVLDTVFAGSNLGLTEPVRKTDIGHASLEIANLDRSDPPAYTPGGFPRSNEFNSNVFELLAAPGMPLIPVVCAVSGLRPESHPLSWRLRCRHVLCRFCKSHGYRYGSAVATFEREWQGTSRSGAFQLFDPLSPASFTYNDGSRLLGGHGLLEVAARVGPDTLLDYVHVRIGGSNPTTDHICSYLEAALAQLNSNIVLMLEALFRHESGSLQFYAAAQGQARMTFTPPYHDFNPAQPNCPVDFQWPPDPANFPLASFDFGVGMSQFTEVGAQEVTPDIAWDWRENLRQAANLFLAKLLREFMPGATWMEWALRSWAAYNGAGSQTERYALEVAKTPEGRRISNEPVLTLPPVVLLPPLAALPPPPPWPPGT